MASTSAGPSSSLGAEGLNVEKKDFNDSDDDSDEGQVEDIHEEDVIAAQGGKVDTRGNNLNEGDELPAGPSTSTIPSLSSDSLKAKLKQGSLEFEFMKPICTEIIREPSEKTLKIFEEALMTLGKVPAHLTEFVVFPFAIHLKVIRNYKEPQRIQLFKALAALLEKCDLSNSYDMFVNIFQKLFVVLSQPGNPTAVDSQLSEDEMKMMSKCIHNICVNGLPSHIDTICKPEKLQVFAHAIFILLQLLAPEVSKDVRLRTLATLDQIVRLCEGKENRSKALYQFLPGVVSRTRKTCIPSAGQAVKAVVQASLSLMGKTIKVSVEFEDPKGLEKADEMLCQIIELLSKDYVLNPDVQYRLSYFDFCSDVAARNTQLPKCSKAISSILLRMKEDDDAGIARGCVEVLEALGVIQEMSFETFTELLTAAGTHLTSGDDTSCVLALKEASSMLSTRKLSFVEFQIFLPLLFSLIESVVWKFRNSITVDKSKRSDPIFTSSTKLCQNVVKCIEIEEIVYEFTAVISELQNSSSSVKNTTGVLVTFNIVLTILINEHRDKLSDFEAANFAQAYLNLIDLQSTEVALNNISAETPAVQSVAEIRKTYLLEGLGILGKGYPVTVNPIILYPLIEHAGMQNSEAVNEAADLALKRISSPSPVDKFLQDNLEFIMNEIGRRMISLSLYPNCPSALVFLAQHFDFSQDQFSSFIENTFQRCSDEFGGGDVQHIYVQVFYALIKSISTHSISLKNEKVTTKVEEKPTLLKKMVKYQKSVGITHPSIIEQLDIAEESSEDKNSSPSEKNPEVNEGDTMNEENEQKLDPVRELVLRISHRVLNFLPNNERNVRLSAMECLILSLPLLKRHEDSVLPLSHTIWQNLIPRFDEKDFVIVRKSFELLNSLCACSGTFLKKRTLEEAFPRLSTLLLNLAKEAEQVKNKNRQYYTYTQAYKLQLTVLQGMGLLVTSIDVQEIELDKIVSGCIMYLNPEQHKNLREAASDLLEIISNGKRCRTVWMKIVACGIRKSPENLPHPSFTPIPKSCKTLSKQDEGTA